MPSINPYKSNSAIEQIRLFSLSALLDCSEKITSIPRLSFIYKFEIKNEYEIAIDFIKRKVWVSQLAQNAETPDNERIKGHKPSPNRA